MAKELVDGCEILEGPECMPGMEWCCGMQREFRHSAITYLVSGRAQWKSFAAFKVQFYTSRLPFNPPMKLKNSLVQYVRDDSVDSINAREWEGQAL